MDFSSWEPKRVGLTADNEMKGDERGTAVIKGY